MHNSFKMFILNILEFINNEHRINDKCAEGTVDDNGCLMSDAAPSIVCSNTI